MVDNSIYRKIFSWLFVGLLITFGSGYFLSINENLADQVLAIGIIPIIIIELVIALLMGFRIQKMHPLTLKIFYIVYSLMTGITFSAVFMTYELNSMMSIFLISALIFGALAFFGYKTKRDLSHFGTILLITLIALIIADLLNILIFKNNMFDIVTSSVGVLIFCGFIAYDMQNVKRLLPAMGEEKTAIFGAYQLYLDFINLFLRLLELFGKEKD